MDRMEAQAYIKENSEECDSGCWEWTGKRVGRGYGGYGNNGRAHRLSASAFLGVNIQGRYVCHHCDNPPCVNPNHLFVGDAAANVRDCIAKGRHPICLKAPVERVCARCEDSYQTRSKRSIYCSPSCCGKSWKDANRPMNPWKQKSVGRGENGRFFSENSSYD